MKTTYNFSISKTPGKTLLSVTVLSLLLAFASKTASAQTAPLNRKTETVQSSVLSTTERIVRGMVKSSDDGAPLPSANVYLKGTTTGTVTDGAGKFEFPIKLKEGDILLFSFVGFESQEYRIPVADEQVSIALLFHAEIMGELGTDQAYAPKTGISGLWSKVKGIF